MITEASAKIFLSQQRGHYESASFRSYCTFNFGSFFNEHKRAAGDLYVLNDDTLAARQSEKMFIEQDGYIVFIPITGAIHYSDSHGNKNEILPGELQVGFTSRGTIVEIRNEYENELVNFLQLRIGTGIPNHYVNPLIVNFDINKYKNNLAKIYCGNKQFVPDEFPFLINIGKFSGRESLMHNLENRQNTAFIFVVEGVFEVQDRLLHARDGLGIWNTAAVEAEALSNDAILIVIEMRNEKR
ncbi:MAG TPA: hypothetical protein VFV68_14715 [Agriterribacter sp.]|nr:hypothetical protein [Agriterribacter sp.]